MDKIALYRKYRPSNFSNVYGQEIVVKTLKSAVENNCINHAYIFSGPRGSGKTSIAKIFSRVINCEHPLDNGDCCGTCHGCLNSGNGCLDIIELDAASNNGVDEIRAIISSTNFLSSTLKYKVYIIDEAHMLTINAWNAFLKTLEEPPQNVVFIFATTEYHKIPATIISRCQRFDFSRLTHTTLTHLLNDICQKENLEIEKEALDIIADLADGAARDAISILDQMTSFTNKITLNDINQVFGLINLNFKIDLLNSIFLKDVENVVLFINEQYEKGMNLNLLISDLIKILFDKIVFMQTNNILFTKILDEKSIHNLQNLELDKMLALLNHFNENLMKISKSNDQLFTTQLILMQAIAIISQENAKTPLPQSINNINQVSNSRLDTTPKTSPISTPKSEENINVSKTMFTTKIRSIHTPEKPEETIKNIEDSSPSKSFVPPKPQAISNAQNIQKKPVTETQENVAPKIEQKIEVVETQSTPAIPQQKPALSIDVKDFFFRIANNNNSQIKEELNNKFLELQANRLLESPIINRFLNAKKFLVCSPNGAILLFDNAKQAENLNEVIENDEMIKWVTDNFNKRFSFIGIDKNLAKELTEEFKLSPKNDFKDVEPPQDKKSNTKSLLLDILAD